MNYNTLWNIKYNTDLLNLILPFIFFIIGIFPLLEKRTDFSEDEGLKKNIKSIYFKIEFFAAVGLIASIILYSINYLASSPLYQKGQCLKLDKKIELSQFRKIQKEKEKKIKVLLFENDFYLVKNSSGYYYEISSLKDFYYKKVKCSGDF